MLHGNFEVTQTQIRVSIRNDIAREKARSFPPFYGGEEELDRVYELREASVGVAPHPSFAERLRVARVELGGGGVYFTCRLYFDTTGASIPVQT